MAFPKNLILVSKCFVTKALFQLFVGSALEFVFRSGSLEVVGVVSFVHKQSFWNVEMLIVNVYFIVAKNSVQDVLYMSNEKKLRLLVFLHFHIRFSFFFVLHFYFFASKFRNHHPWQTSISKPSTSCWNQRKISHPFKINFFKLYNNLST